ncbi:MAG: zinc-binding dehydrogenase, partial [Armatimonadota bacterium]|nr:zinc-binding dehydrogenase [Armatimonadota bacterium]
MCSSATSFHALRKGRLCPGETVAVFGAGGLGLSAVQLARAMGAAVVYAVDIHPRKLHLAQRLGAVSVDASQHDPVAAIRRLTGGQGVDVSLELVGLPLTMRQAFQALGPLGRAVLVGITPEAFSIAPYNELINRETEVIGASDHLASEIPALLEMARRGALDLSLVVTRELPLEAHAINEALDALEGFGGDARTVIVPA